MMNKEFFLKNLWLWKCGLPEKQPASNRKIHILDELIKSEWCPEFEQLMRNRLLMGAFRYGLINEPSKPKYDRISSMQKRLEKYKIDGNDEHLVDVANLAMMEFIEGNHPLKHFSSVDDGEHTSVIPDWV